MTNRYPALAWYRLCKLERKELIHFGIALAALLIGIASHFTEHAAWWTLAAVVLVVGTDFVLLAREYLALAQPRDPKLMVQAAFNLIAEKVVAAKLTKTYALEWPLSDSAVVQSDELNRWIICAQPVIDVHVRASGVERRILDSNSLFHREAFEYLVARLHSSPGKRLFNEAKVSLRTELVPEVASVILGKTSYITSALTNDACTHRLLRREYGKEFVYADLTMWYPLELSGESPRLKNLSESSLSNHVGASTIALAELVDGTCVALLPIQGRSAARSSGKYAPTGSGSLDWADIRKAPGQDLLSVVAYGATRELCEEQSLIALKRNGMSLAKVMERHAVRTRVLGYFRWLEFGGLPQFCCLSTLKIDSVCDLKPDPRELDAHNESAGLSPVVREIRAIADLHAFCRDMLHDRTHLSLPLAVSLDVLRKSLDGTYGTECRDRIIEFIKTGLPQLADD